MDSSQLRLQQAAARARTGDELRAMGKQAAASWSNGRAESLTEAVVETVKAAKVGLSPEQVCRVAEFANHEAYTQEFKKEGRAHRIVDFPGGPADPPRILQILNSGAGGAGPTTKTAAVYNLDDYHRPPERELPEIDADDDVFWRHHKVASTAAPPLSREDPLRAARSLRTKLAGELQHLVAAANTQESIYRESAMSLVEEIKQAALNGSSLYEIAQAMSFVDPTGIYTEEAFKLAAPQLVRSRVFTPEGIEASFNKHGHVANVNLTHPLLVAFGVYRDSLEKTAQIREGQETLMEGIAELDLFFKQASLADHAPAAAEAIESAKNFASQFKPAVEKFSKTKGFFPSVSAFTGHMAPHAGDLASKGVATLVGDGKAAETAGKAVQHLTKHSPHYASALAAWQAYRDPDVREAVYQTNSYLNPLSDAYAQRQYALDNRMI